MRVRRSYGVLGDVWKFFRDLVGRRHVVNLGWDARWSDTDEKMLIAMFTLLERFLLEDWDAWTAMHEGHPALLREVAELARWWLDTRKLRVDGVNAMPIPPIEWTEGSRRTEPTEESCRARNRWEEAHRNSAILTELWYEEDTAMLHRLIAVRDQLWT